MRQRNCKSAKYLANSGIKIFSKRVGLKMTSLRCVYLRNLRSYLDVLNFYTHSSWQNTSGSCRSV